MRGWRLWREWGRDGYARISRVPARPHLWRGPTRLVQFAFAGGLFVLGVGIGTGLGFWLSPEPPVPQAVAPIETVSTVEAALPEGNPLPVIVSTSEQARRIYQESLADQPEALRPDPDQAPPLPLIVKAPPEPVNAGPEPLQETVVDRPGISPNTWLAYAVPADADPAKPMIAIVIDDLGVDQPRSWRVIELPAPFTLAFLPYGYNLDAMVSEARERGHEILVHVPMAPLDLGVDPGPNALQRELGPKEILRRLDWDLAQFDGYVGINNHMGSRFTADAESMRSVIAELKRRGLIFMDSVTTTETQGYKLAAEIGVPFAVRDIFLDHVIQAEAIARQLQRTEATALRQGYAIAIAHPHDESLAVISDWIRNVEDRGFQLVPLSAIVLHRQANLRS